MREIIDLTCEVKATENSRMTADTIDNANWVQKLNHPICLVEFAAQFRALFAKSVTGIAASAV